MKSSIGVKSLQNSAQWQQMLSDNKEHKQASIFDHLLSVYLKRNNSFLFVTPVLQLLQNVCASLLFNLLVLKHPTPLPLLSPLLYNDTESFRDAKYFQNLLQCMYSKDDIHFSHHCHEVISTLQTFIHFLKVIHHMLL